MSLDIKAFTPDELEAAVIRVATTPSYKDAISLASSVYKLQPMTSLQRVVWWIEHVLATGGSHYRSYALDMPWYQYLMLDILVFVLVVVHIAVSLIGFCASKCLNVVRGKPKQKIN